MSDGTGQGGRVSRGGGVGNGVLRQARKLVVLVVGGTVVAVGVAMLVLPGPAVLVIPAGIAILASEFAWARRLLKEVKRRVGLSDGDAAPGPSSPGTGAAGPREGSRLQARDGSPEAPPDPI